MDEGNFDIDPLMGKKVEDRITRFTGIVTGRVEWLFGCTQYTVSPQGVDKNGKKIESSVFDEGRLKVLGKGIRPSEVKAKSGKKGAGEVPKEVLQR